ncbi:type II secretion system protein [Alkalibacterium olivapovliticus]|uniref:Type IV pilus assembly protein PilA n=1 Tax=Alkalibacterium olivapovliticus TaxID=99907 RepID=A0A2T0W9P9_9LACT|nr:type II secretion system protein [Alkalibacterium olivapovliticus]PRY83234.1 type IV pilus assembly protein PilA [Alkalibacterium olivapovliticus]
MRNKIKQLMNKEEGFTLVELLAVIVILGIIVAIAIPAIGNIIDRAQGGANEAEDALVIDAARLYFTTTDEAHGGSVTVGTLKSGGYIEVRDSENLSDTITVTRSGGDGDAYTYDITER